MGPHEQTLSIKCVYCALALATHMSANTPGVRPNHTSTIVTKTDHCSCRWSSCAIPPAVATGLLCANRGHWYWYSKERTAGGNRDTQVAELDCLFTLNDLRDLRRLMAKLTQRRTQDDRPFDVAFLNLLDVNFCRCTCLCVTMKCDDNLSLCAPPRYATVPVLPCVHVYCAKNVTMYQRQRSFSPYTLPLAVFLSCLNLLYLSTYYIASSLLSDTVCARPSGGAPTHLLPCFLCLDCLDCLVCTCVAKVSVVKCTGLWSASKAVELSKERRISWMASQSPSRRALLGRTPGTYGALPTLVRRLHSDGALCSFGVRKTSLLELVSRRMEASPNTL